MPTAHIAAGENTSSQSSKMKQSKNSFSILPIEDRQRARKSHLSTQSAARGLWLGECWYGFFFAFPSSIPKDNSMNTGLVFTCFPIRWQPKLFFIGAKHNKIPRLSKKKKKARLLLFVNVLNIFHYLPASLFQKSVTAAHVPVWPRSSNTDRTSHQTLTWNSSGGWQGLSTSLPYPQAALKAGPCTQRAKRHK